MTENEWNIKLENDNVLDLNIKNAKVNLSSKSYRQIITLCDKFKELEWMAGLKGKIDGVEFHIEELIIFEQNVTKTSVELTDKGNIDISNTEDIIGWIHSHNSMQVFFSSTDISTATWNKLSIVVNNKLEMKASIGMEATITMNNSTHTYTVISEAELIRPKIDMDINIIASADELIKETKFQTTYKTYSDENKWWDKHIVNDDDFVYKITRNKNYIHICMDPSFAQIVNDMEEKPILLMQPVISFKKDGKEVWTYNLASKKEAKIFELEAEQILHNIETNLNSDIEIIEDQKTGYNAYSEEDYYGTY